MSKALRRVIKAGEKFRKNAEKEISRAKALQDKYGALASGETASPLLGQFIERVKQKHLQTTGDLMWADHFLAQAKAEALNEPAEAVGDDGAKKKSKSKDK
jgi:hypothetical protein